MKVEKPSDLIRKNIVGDFFDKVDTIKNDDIREFVSVALEHGPFEFWDARSSSSGNNHPPENNLKSGLLVHIIKALEVAEELFRFFGIEEGSIDEDIVRAAILLHDLYKQGNPWTSVHCKEHGKLCANILMQYRLERPIKEKILKCIETHMSRWTEPIDSLAKFSMADNLQVIVALSDYFSSRNGISFYPKMSILGDE